MQNPALYILLLPLIGAFINGVIGWKLPRRMVEVVACLSVGGSFVMAVRAFPAMGVPSGMRLFDWLSFAWFSAPMEFYFDYLSGTMALMVTGVSFLIHLYSVGYMRGEEGYARYFALLNLFVFFMLTLVLAGNLPLMYLGWEGVGFCSYMLIGFWYKDPANADAGRKAFIVTRVGDVAFGIALVWLYYFAGTTSVVGINAQAASAMPVSTATCIGLLLLFGATGKSAQLPLTVWLPDAMAGPTPVSALIHAATMVTAGVYLLMRMSPVIQVSDTAMASVAALGAVTAFYAATAALAQRDIKRVLAYSTISQIGYMFLAVGAGSVTAGLFHLFVHAFFKALLFMAAGCIIQAMHEEHDMFRMGGLMARMPVVFWSFLAGALALAAAPGTGGFFSKDDVLTAVLAHGSAFYTGLWIIGEAAAFITAFYIFRVVCLVFLGEPKIQPRKVPAVMVITLVPLAALSMLGGIINMPGIWGGTEVLMRLLAGQGLVRAAAVRHEVLVQAVSASMCIAGIAAAYYLYVVNPALRERFVFRHGGLLDFLYNAWYIDRLYYKIFVRPYGRVARVLWHGVDERVVDRAFDGAGKGIAGAGALLRLPVTGRASTYITATVIGAALLLTYFAWSVR